jgi:hypothetical protein
VEDQNRTEDAPSLGVYAAAAALLSSIPVPIVDGLLSDAARGAAFRRVATRHGVRLGAGARGALVAHPYMPKKRGRTLARAARSIVQRAFLPARMATRVEMAARSLVETRLFELYLDTAERREGAPLGVREAERIRAAMNEAVREGLAGVTGALVVRLRGAGSALVGARRPADHLDDRALVERLIDALLDLAADLPLEALEPIKSRFLVALDEEGRA